MAAVSLRQRVVVEVAVDEIRGLSVCSESICVSVSDGGTAAKAEHESHKLVSTHELIRGNTRGYVNLRIRVARWLKPARIQVCLPEHRVLVPSTRKYLNFLVAQ